jgi:hypothetical protein
MRKPLLAILTFCVFTACSPYDPSLPTTAFLCGASEPRCPDGYTCIADGKQMVCHADGEPLPDAGTVDAP